MNSSKLVVSTLAGAVALFAANFVLHVLILGDTYTRIPAFSQMEGGYQWFFLIVIAMALVMSLLFTKTRSSWPAGWKGGAVFGLWVGMITGITQFFFPLTLEGYPAYLAWCDAGCELLSMSFGGAAIGLALKSDA